jgi:hypothetical protein
MLYKLRPSDGAILDAFPTPGDSPSGVGWTGEFVVLTDRSEQLIYLISPVDGSVLDACGAPDRYSSGLATTTGDLRDAGAYVWSSGQDDDVLYMLDLGLPAPAEGLYGSTSNGLLFKVDIFTGAGTWECNLPTAGGIGATEIEYDNLSGRAILQGTGASFSQQLFDIETCNPLGPLTPNGLAFNGLEFVGDVLYGTGIDEACAISWLHIINPETGVTTPIGPTGRGPISGLAWDPEGQTMFGVTGCYPQWEPELVKINLDTGLASHIGYTQVAFGGLAFGTDGRLYGGANNQFGGDLFRIDPGTGAATYVGSTGFMGVTGLTLCRRPPSAVEGTSIADRLGVFLHPNVPNPFNPRTTLRFSLGSSGSADLSLYDLTGRRVTTLVSESVTEGLHQVVWDGTDRNGRPLSSGVFLAILRSQGQKAMRKVILLR